MALTAAQQTDAYRFFSIAFNAAPGVEYMNQIADAYASGMTTQQVVNAFVSKTQFTNVYPTFLTNETFANNLVENIVGSAAAAAAKTQAKADIVAALNSGMSRGDVVYTIFNNLANKPVTDADWGATAQLMANKVAVAQYYTEVLLATSTNLSVLQAVLAGVTPATDVSTPEAIARAIGDAANVPGSTFMLTGGADTTPAFAGGALNDVYVATNATLTAGDRLDGGAGNDSLIYSANNSGAANHGALFMTSVERLQTTLDNGSSAQFDLSGTTGLNTVAAVNSTGDAVFAQVTSVPAGNFTIEADTVTDDANIAVRFQDSKVVGTTNEVLVKLLNNYNALTGQGIGILEVGRQGDTNGGIETISVTTGEAASLVAQLDSDISRLNVAGDQNLDIVTALNNTVDTVAAGGFTGALNINLTGNVAGAGETALSITTGSGNDVIDLLVGNATQTAAEGADVVIAGTTNVVRNATIATGAGNDTVEAAWGDDNINLGEGNDTLVMTVNGLTVADLVNGGADADTLILNAADTIAKSEAERVTQVETFDLRAGGSSVVVTDNLVNTADGGMFTVTTASATGGHTVDLTNLTFSNTNRFTLTGQTGTSDTVIANDATVNAKAILNFGQDGNGTGLNPAGQVDTLRIIEGGNFTADDFANVTGLDAILLQSNSNIAQTYNIGLVNGMFDNNDSSTPAGGDQIDDLVITADRNVPQNSVINLNVSAITGARAVTVRTNSNVTVNLVDNSGNVLVADLVGTSGIVTVLSSLQFTENSDNLQGTVGNDEFTADSLDQIDTADIADGNGGVDRLTVDFSVNNINQALENLFNDANIVDIDNLRFDTANDVRFEANKGAQDTVGGDFDFTGFETDSGDDQIQFLGNAAAAYTVTLNDGDDTVFDDTNANNQLTVDGGNGSDTLDFGVDAAWTAVDRFTGGAGTDTVIVRDAATVNAAEGDIAVLVADDVLADGSLEVFQAISGGDIDIEVNNADLNAFSGSTSVFSLSAGDDVFFSGAALTDQTESMTITVSALGDALVVGGAGNDTITVTAGNFAGTAVDNATDDAGIVGLRGADTINLNTAALNAEYVVYKSSQDGGLEGVDGAAGVHDVINGFESGTDAIVFALAAGDYATANDTGNGSIGSTLDAKGGAGVVNAVTNAAAIDLNVDELAVFDTTTLSDANLLSLSTVASYISANSALTNDTIGDVIVFAVQGVNDTAIYWFTSDNADGDVTTDELSLMGVVSNELLVAADFIYA